MSKPFDLDYLAAHNHISPEDAQSFHVHMMCQHGITDADEHVADWNRRDPVAPWGSGIVGKYIIELTDLVCHYMEEKIREGASERGGSQ